MAETAFAIACENLFGLDDETIEQWSRPVRWAQLLREWPDEKKGPLLQSLNELHYQENPAASFDPQGRFGGPDKGMHDDIGLLSLAMHDTTTSSMTSFIMELARRPEMQAQVA